MQFHRFNKGGFVAHKVCVSGRDSKFSLWGDANGNLLDCAYAGTGRSVAHTAVGLRADLARRCKAIHETYKGES